MRLIIIINRMNTNCYIFLKILIILGGLLGNFLLFIFSWRFIFLLISEFCNLLLFLLFLPLVCLLLLSSFELLTAITSQITVSIYTFSLFCEDFLNDTWILLFMMFFLIVCTRIFILTSFLTVPLLRLI